MINPHITDYWKEELDRLEAGGDLGLPVRDADGNLDADLVLVKHGKLQPGDIDYLARWCFDYLGLDHACITAPSWGHAMRSAPGNPKGPLCFYYWCFDPHYIAIYLDDSDAKGHGQWDRCFVIDDMPVPEPRLPIPDHLKGETPDIRAERIEWLRQFRPRRRLLDALALAHFAEWLQENQERSTP